MPSIVVKTGEAAGEEYKLSGRIVIGRQPEGDGITIQDALASRQHAEVVTDGSRWIIRDLESRNGTFVDGKPITEAALTNGAVIKIGHCQLTFQDETAAVRQGSRRRLALTMDGGAEPQEAPAAPESEIEIQATPMKLAGAEQLVDVATAQRFYKRLRILFDATKALGGTRSVNEVLDDVMRRLLEVFPAADRSFVVLADPETGDLVPAAVRTRAGEAPRTVNLSRTVVRKVMTEKRAILSREAGELSLLNVQSIQTANMRSFMCAPLLYRDRALGILQVDSELTGVEFNEDDLTLLSGLAIETALAVQNSREEHERQLLYLSNIGTMVRAVEARDPYTRGHSMRVSDYCVAVAERMNKRPNAPEPINLDRLRYAGQLHDAGKISIGQEVLHKPAPLSNEEFTLMKHHPVVTHFLLSEMHLPPELKGLDVLAALHHERYDGKGYPCGFKGTDIPIEARIMAAADTFDAMTSDRPYRKRMDPNVAVAEITRCAGTQIDPEVAVVFAEAHQAGALNRILGGQTEGEMASMPDDEGFRRLMVKLLESFVP